MEFLIILGLIIIIGYAFREEIEEILKKIQKPGKKKEVKLPYKKEKYLMNISERKFFEEVENIIDDDYVIIPQISLNSILKTNSKNNFWKYQNKINKKIVDFLICKKPYFEPVMIVEYDGRTHNRKDRKERDLFLDKALKSAGLEVLHFKHRKNISREAVKKELNNFEVVKSNKIE